MPTINLNNYEAWFLDYSEGRLSLAQIEELEGFLEEHPHLRTDLLAFDVKLTLTGNPIEYPEKQAIKKPQIQAYGGIDETNHETQFINFLEKTADAPAASVIEGFLSHNPHLRREMQLLEMTVQKPDLSIAYPWKDNLKKKVVFPLWGKAVMFAAAASVAIFLLWFGILQKDLQNGKYNSAGTAAITQHITDDIAGVPEDAANPHSQQTDEILETQDAAGIINAGELISGPAKRTQNIHEQSTGRSGMHRLPVLTVSGPLGEENLFMNEKMQQRRGKSLTDHVALAGTSEPAPEKVPLSNQGGRLVRKLALAIASGGEKEKESLRQRTSDFENDLRSVNPFGVERKTDDNGNVVEYALKGGIIEYRKVRSMD